MVSGFCGFLWGKPYVVRFVESRTGRGGAGEWLMEMPGIPTIFFPGGEMDPVTAFGAAAVTAMMVFYAMEDRHPAFVLAFAAACLASSAYGFLAGTWPFGVVELVWSGVAARRWWRSRSATPPLRRR